MRRDLFLDRVSAALRGAELPGRDDPVDPPFFFITDPVAKFVAEAEAVAAEVTRAGDSGAAFAAVRDVLAAHETRRFIAWDGLGDVLPGWDAWVRESGFERVDATVEPEPGRRGDDLARVGSVAVGITTASQGIAGSGSVVLRHGPGRPRSASLLVESHIVLLPAHRIAASLLDTMGLFDWDRTSNVVIITGPSRTGDIESRLTLGVHGPRRLHIVVIG